MFEAFLCYNNFGSIGLSMNNIEGGFDLTRTSPSAFVAASTNERHDIATYLDEAVAHGYPNLGLQ